MRGHARFLAAATAALLVLGGTAPAAVTAQSSYVYNAVYSCLDGNNGSNISSCVDNATATGNSVSQQADQIQQCLQSCQATYDDCANSCNNAQPLGGAPDDAAYQAVISCLQGQVSCPAVLSQYGLSMGSAVVQEAYNDIQNGTIKPPSGGGQAPDTGACLDSCSQTLTACQNQCDSQPAAADDAQQAAQRAVDDWAKAHNPAKKGDVTKSLQALRAKATHVTPTSIKDAKGKDVAANDVLRGGVDDTLPVVTLRFPLKNAKQGAPISADVTSGPPETFPVEGVIVQPAQDVANGSLEVQVSGGSKPEILGEGAPGTPDFIRPDAPPDPKQFTMQDYIRIGATETPGTAGENAPVSWSDVWLSIFKNTGNAITDPDGSIRMLHYNRSTRVWDPLPTERYLCDYAEAFCRYSVHSTGNSLFALVVARPGANVTTPPATINSPQQQTIIITLPFFLRWSFWRWVAIAFWASVLLVIYFESWRKYARQIRAAGSRDERQRIVREIGLARFAFIAGLLLFGGAFSVSVLAISSFVPGFGGARTLASVGVCFIGGFVFGLVVWLILSHGGAPKRSVTAKTKS